MIKDEIHKLMYETRQLLEQQEYTYTTILYVLENAKDINQSISGICNKDYEIYEVTLKDKEIKYLYEWDYNVDQYVFYYLEKEYNIGYISMDFHGAIWRDIGELDIEEIEYKVGLQKYLKYCKENNIDKTIIDKETKSDVPDIMEYYDEQTNYIKMGNGLVEMSKEKYQQEKEINYIAFCLGYDLINNMLSESEVSECDLCYDFCDYLARKFIETNYYKNKLKSTYDNLQEWLDENKDIIKSEFLQYNAIDYKIIMETTKRKDIPIALVEITGGQPNSYVIAFNYKVTDKKTEWDYGYYYDKDFNKAKEDFEKVKAGGNLIDTFKDEETRNKEMPRNMKKFEKIKKKMEKIIENDDSDYEYKLECVLIDKKNIKKSYGIAMDNNDVAIVDMSGEIEPVKDGEYNFDIGEDFILPHLEIGKMEIAYMSMNIHYGIWQEIDRYYPKDTDYKKGVQMYLRYCKENNITKEVIDKGINNTITPDVMRYFQEKNTKNKNREER